MLRKTIAINKRSVCIQAVVAARNWANVGYLYNIMNLNIITGVLLVLGLYLGCFSYY